MISKIQYHTCGHQPQVEWLYPSCHEVQHLQLGHGACLPVSPASLPAGNGVKQLYLPLSFNDRHTMYSYMASIKIAHAIAAEWRCMLGMGKRTGCMHGFIHVPDPYIYKLQ